MRSNKGKRQLELVGNIRGMYWKLFGADGTEAHVFSCYDVYDGDPMDLAEGSTMVYLEEFPSSLWLHFYSADTIKDFYIKAALADMICTLGEEGMYEALLKSVKSADKLLTDLYPADNQVLQEKALDALIDRVLRMYEMYKAAMGSPEEDTVKRDLASMFPGVVFMALWYGTLSDLIENDGVRRVYDYDHDGMTLEDAVRLFSSKTVDYAHKLRREYGKGTPDPG